VLGDIEEVAKLVIRVDAVDDFIRDLHPLASEALENSFCTRSALLSEAVAKLAENFSAFLNVRKGSATVERVFSKLAAALNPGDNAFGMRIKRLSHESFSESLLAFDLLLARFFVFGGAAAQLPELCEIFGRFYKNNPKFGTNVVSVFLGLDSDGISRFLVNHPLGVKVFTSLIMIYTDIGVIVSALCNSCERLHTKVTSSNGEESLQDLWNLLVAVLQRASDSEKTLIQTKIGNFLQAKINR